MYFRSPYICHTASHCASAPSPRTCPGRRPYSRPLPAGRDACSVAGTAGMPEHAHAPALPWSPAQAAACLADFERTIRDGAHGLAVTPLAAGGLSSSGGDLSPAEQDALARLKDGGTPSIRPDAPSVIRLKRENAQRTLLLAWLQEQQNIELKELARSVTRKQAGLAALLGDRACSAAVRLSGGTGSPAPGGVARSAGSGRHPAGQGNKGRFPAFPRSGSGYGRHADIHPARADSPSAGGGAAARALPGSAAAPFRHPRPEFRLGRRNAGRSGSDLPVPRTSVKGKHGQAPPHPAPPETCSGQHASSP